MAHGEGHWAWAAGSASVAATCRHVHPRVRTSGAGSHRDWLECHTVQAPEGVSSGTSASDATRSRPPSPPSSFFGPMVQKAGSVIFLPSGTCSSCASMCHMYHGPDRVPVLMLMKLLPYT